MPPLASMQGQAIETVRERADDSAIIRQLSKCYTIPESATLPAFLAEHPDALQLLLAAAPRLREDFGDEAELRLRFSPGDFADDTLYAVVVWAGEPSLVRQALSRFDDWWIQHAGATGQFVCITYELV